MIFVLVELDKIENTDEHTYVSINGFLPSVLMTNDDRSGKGRPGQKENLLTEKKIDSFFMNFYS